MESYNSDPKPGRLILPLVLIGMIATTYTFVNRVVENNNLEIIEETVVEETVVEETSTTTTTTIPEDVVQYLEEITGEKIQAIGPGKECYGYLYYYLYLFLSFLFPAICSNLSIK